MAKLNAHIIPVTPFQQNCTLLFDEESKTGVLIDPGGDLPNILEAINKTGITVESIWLTHGHFDHASSAMDAKDALGVDIIGPDINDKFLLDDLEQSTIAYQLPYKVRNCVPDRWLNDGDELICAGHRFKVIHTPGHTPGHVIFYNEDMKFIIMGDVLFHGSIGRTDFPGGNHETLLSSIKNKVLPLGDDVSFICGHGPGSQLGIERQSNPFLQGL